MKAKTEIETFLRAVILLWDSRHNADWDLTPTQFIDKYYYDAWEWLYK